MRQIEVWNAHFAASPCRPSSARTMGHRAAWAAAIHLTTFGMLSSRLYEVFHQSRRPARHRGVFQRFQFPGESPRLNISGRRVVVFGPRPPLGRVLAGTTGLGHRCADCPGWHRTAGEPARQSRVARSNSRSCSGVTMRPCWMCCCRPGGRGSMPCRSGGQDQLAASLVAEPRHRHPADDGKPGYGPMACW